MQAIADNILDIYQIHTKLGMEISLFICTNFQSNRVRVFYSITNFEKCAKRIIYVDMCENCNFVVPVNILTQFAPPLHFSLAT